MGVEVIGYLTHDRVDPELAIPELLSRHTCQLAEHVRFLVSWRTRAMALPDHHRHRADLALGDPAHLVFVEPGRDPGGLAELAGRRPGRPVAFVNGAAGALVASGVRVLSVTGFTVANGKIAKIDALIDPERLAGLHLTLPGA
jgi:hypothetical protein